MKINFEEYLENAEYYENSVKPENMEIDELVEEVIEKVYTNDLLKQERGN